MLASRTYSISIERDWQALYEAVWRPEIFPKWASGLTESNEPFASLKGKYLQTFLTDPSRNQAYYYVGNGSRYGICADLESDPGTRYEVGPSGSRQVQGAAKDCALLN